jgi:hypothetical protein
MFLPTDTNDLLRSALKPNGITISQRKSFNDCCILLLLLLFVLIAISKDLTTKFSPFSSKFLVGA